MARYSKKMYDLVAAADMDLLGVQFGAACIDAQIPVQVVARWLGVTRQGVYYWFTGVTEVAEKHRAKIGGIQQVLLNALNDEALPVDDLVEALQIIKKYRGVK